ncbi:hypothetical protein GYH30_053078 [Glycine max]|nr:hypothetical protein GYH30_053078 [Glycine max]
MLNGWLLNMHAKRQYPSCQEGPLSSKSEVYHHQYSKRKSTKHLGNNTKLKANN